MGFKTIFVAFSIFLISHLLTPIVGDFANSGIISLRPNHDALIIMIMMFMASIVFYLCPQIEGNVDKTTRTLTEYRTAEAKSKRQSHAAARENEKLQDATLDIRFDLL